MSAISAGGSIGQVDGSLRRSIFYAIITRCLKNNAVFCIDLKKVIVRPVLCEICMEQVFCVSCL